MTDKNGDGDGDGDGHQSLSTLAWELIGEVVCGTAQRKRLVMERMRAIAYEKGPRAQEAAGAAVARCMEWMHHAGSWNVFLLATAGIIGFFGLLVLAIVVLLFVTATGNGIMISFMFSLSIVGFLMTFFFTSLAAVYVGALLAAAVTISAVTFFSICGMIVAAGWFGLSRGLWNGITKVVLLVRDCIALAASSLCSMMGVESTKILAFQTKHFE